MVIQEMAHCGCLQQQVMTLEIGDAKAFELMQNNKDLKAWEQIDWTPLHLASTLQSSSTVGHDYCVLRREDPMDGNPRDDILWSSSMMGGHDS